MDLQYTFDKKHDEFIDIIKGFAILFVIINHCLPHFVKSVLLFNLWGGGAVPLFLLLQSYHYFKRGLNNTPAIKFGKIFRRIILPFLISQFILIVFNCLFFGDFLSSVSQWVMSFGMGPGEYYPWIYLQFVVLLPVFAALFRKCGTRMSLVVSILIAVGLELCMSCLHPDKHIYKFLSVRYLFLIYLGYVWAQQGGVRLDNKTLIISLVGVCSILFFDYADVSLEPLFYASEDWQPFHWISYFYSANLFVFILLYAYRKMPQRFKVTMAKIGCYSYEIFCCQMVVITVLNVTASSFVSNQILRGAIYLLLGPILSVVPVLWYKEYIRKKSAAINYGRK